MEKLNDNKKQWWYFGMLFDFINLYFKSIAVFAFALAFLTSIGGFILLSNGPVTRDCKHLSSILSQTDVFGLYSTTDYVKGAECTQISKFRYSNDIANIGFFLLNIAIDTVVIYVILYFIKRTSNKYL